MRIDEFGVGILYSLSSQAIKEIGAYLRTVLG